MICYSQNNPYDEYIVGVILRYYSDMLSVSKPFQMS